MIYQGEVPPGLWDVLEAAHEGGIALKGDFARALAPEVALAASLGYISVVSVSGLTWTPKWNITLMGLDALQHKETTLGL